MLTENMVQVVSLSLYLFFSILSRYSYAAKEENVGCFTLIFLWLSVCCVVACWKGLTCWLLLVMFVVFLLHSRVVS